MSHLLRKRLNLFRRRERFLALAWIGARWVTSIAVVLAIACSADWLIDRSQETPRWLRYGMTAGQLALAVGLGLWLSMPLFRRLNDSRLALAVEDGKADLQHVLISAVQLSAPSARTDGMSPELIALVVTQAEEQTRDLDFARFADNRRLKWTLALFVPVILTATVACASWPELIQALLQRQALVDAAIPRSVHLENITDEVWPIGETIELQFQVTGDGWSEDSVGEVKVSSTDGGRSESYPLTLKDAGSGIFHAQVPGSSVPLAFHAFLLDGRLAKPGVVSVVGRPLVIEHLAHVALPAHCGLMPPEGKPYELRNSEGQIAGLIGARARVAIRVQKPIVKAHLELLSLQANDALAVSRTVVLTISETQEGAHGSFALQIGESHYRVRVWDQHGFENLRPALRRIDLLAEEAPRVNLLPERYADDDDQSARDDEFDLDGAPITLGAKVRIAYTCSCHYGLGHARLIYRVNDEPWRIWLLDETPATEKTGPFDPEKGAFQKSRWDDEIGFHAMPSSDPRQFLSRTQGGGRFVFRTLGLTDLKLGDRLEYYVEVFNRNPNAPGIGASAIRVKNIVTPRQLRAWLTQVLQEENRLRQLEVRQRSVFDKK